MDKVLLVVICLMSISNIYSVQTETIETWGNLYNVRAIEEKTATVKWFLFKVQQRTLRFPTVNEGQINHRNKSVFRSVTHMNMHNNLLIRR